MINQRYFVVCFVFWWLWFLKLGGFSSPQVDVVPKKTPRRAALSNVRSNASLNHAPWRPNGQISQTMTEHWNPWLGNPTCQETIIYLCAYLPSGKHTRSYGKWQSLMGKSTINGPCSIAMLNYQRVVLCLCMSIHSWNVLFLHMQADRQIDRYDHIFHTLEFLMVYPRT